MGFNDLSRKHQLIIMFIVLFIIGLITTFYADYRMHHITIDGHVYTAEEFDGRIGSLISETGPDVILSSTDNRNIYYIFGDNIVLTIGNDDYQVEFEPDLNKNKSDNYFVEYKDNNVSINKIFSVLTSKDKSLILWATIVNLIVTALVSMNLIYPYISWKLEMLFITKGGGPTDYYIIMNGIVSIIVWCATFIWLLKISW